MATSPRPLEATVTTRFHPSSIRVRKGANAPPTRRYVHGPRARPAGAAGNSIPVGMVRALGQAADRECCAGTRAAAVIDRVVIDVQALVGTKEACRASGRPGFALPPRSFTTPWPTHDKAPCTQRLVG